MFCEIHCFILSKLQIFKVIVWFSLDFKTTGMLTKLHYMYIVQCNWPKFEALISKRHLFILTGIFLFNGPPLLHVTLRSPESWIEEKITSKGHKLKSTMCLFATDLPVSFQAFC